MTGRSGWDALPVPPDEWIALPEGGSLYELPGRRGIGIDVRTGQMRLCEKGWAVAAFIPPAHTGLYLAAYETEANAPTLPLFCYTAAGWLDSKFYVPAVRIEQDIRQDCAGYDWDIINAGVDTLLKAYPHNRLVKHLANNCCLTYHCPAARNYFMGRWECPDSLLTGLQCQLYRLHLFPTTGRDHSIHPGPPDLQTDGRRDRRIHGPPPGIGPFPYRQLRPGL